MNTTPIHPDAAASGSGCSTIVVAMITVLSLIIGFLAGAGSLFGFLKSDPGALDRLGIPHDGSTVAADCPVCEEGGEVRAASAPTYALVYPIEQTLRIEGELDQDRLRDYVIKRRFELQTCYQRVLETDAQVKGEISLQFTLSSSGKVLAAVVRHDTVNSEALKSCVVDALKGWEVPAESISSEIAVVKFDVLFTPIGSGGP